MDLEALAPILLGVASIGTTVGLAITAKARQAMPAASLTDALRWRGIHQDGKTVLNKNGTGFVILALKGIHYAALAESVVQDIRNRKKAWLLENAGHQIIIQFRTIHRAATVPMAVSADETFQEIDSRWADALSSTFDTEHFICIQTTKPQQFGLLYQAAEGLQQKCPEFEARYLTNSPNVHGHSELCSYLFELLNGVSGVSEPIEKDLNSRLFVSHIEPEIGGIIRQSSYYEESYYGVLSVTGYGDDTGLAAMPALLAANLDFDLFVTTQLKSMPKASSNAEFRLKQATTFLRFQNPIIEEEWITTIQEIQAGEETLADTTFIILIRASTRAEVKRDVDKVAAILGAHNWTTVAEETLAFRAFLSRFPGFTVLDRPRNLRTVNLVDIVPQSGAPKGNSSCLWGPRPMRVFPTAGESSPYQLTYHPTEGDDSSPHDIIIAGTRSGKTVFEAFRAAGAHSSYPDLRQVLFDRNAGLRIFTDYAQGQYLLPGNGTLSLNPFDAPKTSDTFQIQERLLAAMAGLNDPVSQAIIAQAVQDVGALDGIFTLPEVWRRAIPEGPVKTALTPWASNARYSEIFGGKKDAFDPLGARITAIALDNVIDDPKLAGVLAFYILSRIQTSFVANELPYRITVDEASTLLRDKAIAELVASEIRTAAKNKGQVSTIWQDFRSLKSNPIGDALLANVGTLYIWPNTAEDADECDALGSFRFSETEKQFVLGSWRPPRSTRPILLKREAESVFLETDLSGLGPYLKVFRGGFDLMKEYRQCLKEYPENWRQQFVSS